MSLLQLYYVDVVIVMIMALSTFAARGHLRVYLLTMAVGLGAILAPTIIKVLA